MRVFSYVATLVTLCLCTGLSHADLRVVRHGYIKVEIDGVEQAENYSQENTAATAAANASAQCGGTCEVVVVSRYRYEYDPPDIVFPPVEPDPPPVEPEPEPDPPVVEPEPEPDPVTVEWTNPTQRENGDPLSIDELESIIIRYKTGTSDWVAIEVNPTPSTYTFPAPFSPGIWEFQLLAMDTTPEGECAEDAEPLTCGGPLLSEYSESVFLAIGDVCAAEQPTGFIVSYTDTHANITWDTPVCGQMLVEQCKADAAGNCWEGPPIAIIDGPAAIPLSELSLLRINDKGECGLRIRHQGDDGVSAKWRENWSNDICTE